MKYLTKIECSNPRDARESNALAEKLDLNVEKMVACNIWESQGFEVLLADFEVTHLGSTYVHLENGAKVKPTSGSIITLHIVMEGEPLDE